MQEKTFFISFEPHKLGFIGFVSLGVLENEEEDPEMLINNCVVIYKLFIDKLRSKLETINGFRQSGRFLPAREIWFMGDIIFEMIEELKKKGVEIDGVYKHLSRDLDVNSKWLEKVIILRRYIKDIGVIPTSLNWGRVEKGTRRKAELLNKGLSIDT